MATRSGGWLVALGGATMAALWPLFTSLHGPTSFNQDRQFLGRDPLFWGAMMEGPTSLLIAVGLALLIGVFWGGGVAARIGYVLVLISLVVPGVLDLVLLATVPPLLNPLEAVGLGLLASAGRRLHPVTRVASAAMAVLLALSMWSVFVPIDAWDAVNGYRIYGLLVNVGVGLGWVVVGVTEALRGRR